MAMIIDLHEAMARHGPPSARRLPRADAEIVFFPGIRYERHEAPQNVEAHPPSRQHDKLELPEK